MLERLRSDNMRLIKVFYAYQCERASRNDLGGRSDRGLPDDKYGPSCVILGSTGAGRRFKAQCS